MINLGEVIEHLDKSISEVKGMYRILFNGKWIHGRNKTLFHTEKAAKTSLSLEISWTIANFLCCKRLGVGLYELWNSQFKNLYNEEDFKKEARDIIKELIKNGTIVIEEIK